MAVYGNDKVSLLAAAGNNHWVDCPETSSSIITITGNYTGDIGLYMSSMLESERAFNTVLPVLDNNGVSLGGNLITGDGTAQSKEFTAVNGGQSIGVVAQSNFSGLAYVRITSSHNVSTVNVVGYTDSAPHKALIDQVETITYIGKAYAGSSEAAPVWRISLLTKSGNDYTLEFADGDPSFSKVWNDRQSYTYN